MKIVIIKYPYRAKENVTIIPVERITSVSYDFNGTGSASNPYECYIHVLTSDGKTHSFDFGKDEESASKCLESIIVQIRGE